MNDLPPNLQPPVPRGPRSEDLDPAFVDAMFAEIAGMTIDRKPGWWDRLAELPTSRRVMGVAGAVLLISAAWLAGMGWRGDLVGSALGQYVLLSLAVLGAGAVAGLASLRSPHRRLPGGYSTALLLTVPVFMAAIPEAWPGMRPPEGIPLGAHVMCGMMGLTLGALYAIPLLLVQRERTNSKRVVLIGAFAGAIAFVVQNLVCGAGETTHLVFAHGFGSAALAMILLGGAWISARTLK